MWSAGILAPFQEWEDVVTVNLVFRKLCAGDGRQRGEDVDRARQFPAAESASMRGRVVAALGRVTSALRRKWLLYSISGWVML